MFTSFVHPWPRAVVFDCDGLLVRSDGCWQIAYAHALGAAGASLADVDLDPLLGASVADAARGLSHQIGRPVDERLLRRSLIAAAAGDAVEAMPGARSLLDALAGRLPIAVATNGPQELARACLHRCALLDHVDVLVSAERCARHKPAPDVYLAACAELGVDPSDAVALEDSWAGATAAARAGMIVIGVGLSTPAEVDLRVGRLDDPRIAELLDLPRVRF